MIQAIIFDCFGVLSTEGWLPFKQKHFANRPELFEEASELRRQVDAGLLAYENFVQRVAKMADVAEGDVRTSIERHAPNEELFTYITDSLKPRYKIGLLSNAGGNILDTLFTKQQVALFDAVALSYETGVTKPDSRAYQLIAGKLGLPLADCLFVDDQERHCTAAQAAGMHAIVYTPFDEFKRELEALLASVM